MQRDKLLEIIETIAKDGTTELYLSGRDITELRE